MEKSKLGYIFLVVLMLLTACGTIASHNQGAPSGSRGTGGGGNNAGSSGQNGAGLTARNVGSGTTPAGMHHNTILAVNNDIARQIAAMPEIKSASAVATESNIYVAVRLKEDYQAPSDRRQTAMNQDQQTSPPRTDVISGITGNSFDLWHPDRSPIASTNDVSAEMKQKIVDKVRALSDPSLHHVYVSANPDFRTIIERYSQDAGQGKPLSVGIEEFNVLAQRIFPTADGTGAYGGSTSSGAPGKVYGNSSGTNFGTR